MHRQAVTLSRETDARILGCLIILLALAGCSSTREVARTPSETARPSPAITLSTSTPEPQPTHTPTASPTATDPPPTETAIPTLTPVGARSGGITGVFVTNQIEDGSEYPYYEFLRLYEDGVVVSASIFLKESPASAWSSIRTWFYRGSDSLMSQGAYYLSGKFVWFTTIFNDPSKEAKYPQVIVDYSGIYTKEELILNSYSHANGNRDMAVRFARLNVAQ